VRKQSRVYLGSLHCFCHVRLLVVSRKNIIEQAIPEKNSAAPIQTGNSTEAPSGSTSHIRDSNAIASELRSRWEPGSNKPTIKLARESPTVHQSSELPLSARGTLAGKAIARLDAYDKVSASSLDKFYKSKERSRRDSAQWSAGGSGAATPVVGNGDPRLIGRTMDYDASRDPRLRR